MKQQLFLLLFLIFSGKLFSQDFKIPTIDWEHTDTSVNYYVDLLKLKDRDALIIKIGYSSYWTKGVKSECIVFQNDGKVIRYIVFQPASPELKVKVKRKRVKKKAYSKYWAYLQECAQNNRFKIDKSKLNITSKKGQEKGTMETMVINDGADYIVQICQGKNYLNYSSYMPETYIEHEYPGSEERQKLVDLMNGFEALASKK